MKPLKNFQDFEAYLATFTNYEKQRFHYGADALRLERMRSFVDELDNPHADYPAIHIAGTKGKGSTSLMLEALLGAEGFRVGTYTSPHVEHLCERIRVRGESIDEQRLVGLVNSLLPVLEACGRDGDRFPTFFELMTALAMAHFSAEKVDWAVFEVGLGGRLDATNVLAPRLTAITSIGLEHTTILGSTLRKIAREKAGVIKERTPVVVGSISQEPLEEILARALDRNAEVFRSSNRTVSRGDPGFVQIEGLTHPVSAPTVRGPALRANLAVALTLFRLVLEASGRSLSPDRVVDALGRLRLPARVELFEGSPPVVLDGAHTTESVLALRETLEEIGFPRPRTVVFALARDKSRDAILETVRTIGERFIFTVADPVRSLEPSELRRCLGEGDVIEDARDALQEAIRLGDPVVGCGSIYLAGKVRKLLRDRAPRPGPHESP